MVVYGNGDGEKFNSLTNYLSVQPFRWLEIGYGYTLWKMHKNLDPKEKTGFYAKDRYFSAGACIRIPVGRLGKKLK